MEEDKIMLKIIDILDKIRKNTEEMVNNIKGKRMMPPKRDPEVDEMLDRKKVLHQQEVPLDDKIRRENERNI